MKISVNTRIAVIGLGYVGLPLAVEFGKRYPTLGDDALMRRREIDGNYRALLKDVAGIHCLNDTGETICNHAYFPILVNEEYPLRRDELYYKLREHNIYARRYFYPLISDLPMYRQERSADCANLPMAKDASMRVLCLPIYPALSQDEQEWIVDLIQES